ncbi:MAG TPA: Spy/CpxP family protein refolding chaperone [bacterium]
MTHKHLIIHLLVGLPLLALLALHLHWYHHNLEFHAFHGRRIEKMSAYFIRQISKKLDLDSRQKAVLTDIRDGIMAEHRRFRQEADTAFQDLLVEIEKDSLDKAVLNRLAQKHQECMEAMHSSAVEKLAAFHASLTPEQKQKLTVMIKKHFQNHRL